MVDSDIERILREPDRFFLCPCCWQLCESAESDTTGKAEAAALWPDLPPQQMSQVCESCYGRIKTAMEKEGSWPAEAFRTGFTDFRP